MTDKTGGVQMSVNNSTIQWLELQEHPVAFCVVWTKTDADSQRAERGEPPLTDDQWMAVLDVLEKGGPSELDWENLDHCIGEVLQ
jgi:hypothetical protein